MIEDTIVCNGDFTLADIDTETTYLVFDNETLPEDRSLWKAYFRLTECFINDLICLGTIPLKNISKFLHADTFGGKEEVLTEQIFIDKVIIYDGETCMCLKYF